MSALARFNTLKVRARTRRSRSGARRLPSRRSVRRSTSPRCSRAACTNGVTGCASGRSSAMWQGYQLWSESYDRQLTDIFCCPVTEITTRIIDALQLHLQEENLTGPSDEPARRPRGVRDRAAWPLSLEPAVARRLCQGGGSTRGREACAAVRTRLFRTGRRLPQPVRLRVAVLVMSRPCARALRPRRRWNSMTPRPSPHVVRAHPADEWSAGSGAALPARIRARPELHAGSALECALCQTALGRTDEAIKAMRRAQQLDPLSVRINADLGMAYLAAGQYEEAVAQEGAPSTSLPTRRHPAGSAAWHSATQAVKDARARHEFAFDAWSGE